MRFCVVALGLVMVLAKSELPAQQVASAKPLAEESEPQPSGAEPVVQQAVSQKPVAEESAQQPSGLVPRPFLYAGAGLMGGGYAPLAWEGGGGLIIDTRHFLASAEGSYDNGHKTDDGGPPNPKGHDRGLAATAYFRLSSGWFAGVGARWSQLSTTNYTKGAWRPTFGGGKDYFHKKCAAENCVSDFSMRAGIDYVLPGGDHLNALQGPLLSFYMPSPSAKGHIFFRETLGIYEFHETVTEPSIPSLTQQQIGNRYVTSFGELTVMYRF
jgi:hypothetical protein